MILGRRIRSSLRARFVLAIGGAVLAASGLFFLLGALSLRRTIQGLSVGMGRVLVERYAAAVGNLLAMHNELELDDLSSVVGRTGGVVEAYVLDPNGMYVTHSDFRMLGRQRPVYRVVRMPDRLRPFEVAVRPDGRRVWIFTEAVGTLTAHVEMAPELLVRRPLVNFLLRFSALFVVVLVAAMGLTVRTVDRLVRPIREMTRGVEVVASGNLDHRLPVRGEDELAVLTSTFNRMTASLKEAQELRIRQERMRAELEFAAEIQMKMMPSVPLALPGYRVEHLCLPAKEVGGDYYDLFPTEEGLLGMVLCDVSGKGVPAALVTGMLKTIFRALAGRGVGAAETLRTANRILRENIRHKVFATALYAELDLRKHRLVWAMAGGGRLFVRDASGGVRILRLPGLPLGLMDDGVFREEMVEEILVVEAGGVVFACTDGVTETRSPDGRFFGEEAVRDVLASWDGCGEFGGRLLAALEAFRGGGQREDDISFLMLRREA